MVQYNKVPIIKGSAFFTWVKLQNSYIAMTKNMPKSVKKLSVENKIEANNNRI
jgi:hypothetical protein